MSPRRPLRSYSYGGLAGCVEQWRSRETNTLVGLYASYESGMETDPEYPWTTVCEQHGTLVSHPTLAAARRVRSPLEFCGDCRELETKKP